ncbi:cation transporter [Candidatus Bipolaricaulota bacterium]|nr:cation transporter [Candidatus Bipolaricaulota bacterium]
MNPEPQPTADQATVNRWHRIALGLVIGTLAYNVIEAAVALWSGTQAGSIALFGFGLDSVIETVAAGVLLWRLWHGVRGVSEQKLAEMDRRVYRVVGVTFVLLAAYIVFQSAWTLIGRMQPQRSVIGIGLAIASVIVMPLVSIGKIRAARRLKSVALLAEAKETLACSYLSLTLLLGLLLNSTLGWWWADPVAALLMVPWITKEGIEGLQGEGCGCH